MNLHETTKKDLVISKICRNLDEIQSIKMALYLLVYLKRCKVNSAKQSPLFLRISVGKQRVEISLRRYVSPDLWDSDRQLVKGRNEEARSINEQINAHKIAIHNHYSRLLKGGEQITAHSLKCALQGIDVNSKSLNEAFEYHNLKVKEQIGNGFAQATYTRYLTTHKLLKEFMKLRYKTDDIALNRISLEFVTEFDYYLRVVRKCNNNTTVKYTKNFKKIINLALSMEWLEKDPFTNYKAKIEQVDRECLFQHEIDAIREKHFGIERLEQIKDLFLFSCFTGLAYADVQKLSKDNVIKGFNGVNWVEVHRTKTNSLSKIPLLPVAQEILNKYANHPSCLAKDRLLPVPSNQKVNAYLKEIADICGIKKVLTFHIARHTFATTVTLANKVPIETVSKMLGHKDLKTTQHYARVLDSKVSDDMSVLYEKFGGSNRMNNETKMIAL